MSHYLVTGGAGFIGSHVVERLTARGDVVRVVDDLSTGRRDNIERCAGVELVEADLTGDDVAARAVAGIDYVVHLAAIPSVPRSVHQPLETHRVNVDATHMLLLAAREAAVKRVVLASSSAVYGESPILPKHEAMPTTPKSPYGLHKLIGERYAALFWELYGLETVSLRFFNVFGPRQAPGSQYSGVVSLFIAALLDGRPPTIYGDGAQTRDFTFVSDVVDGVLSACVAPGVAGRVLNLARGERVSVNDLLASVRRVTANTVEAIYGDARAGDVRDSQADISRARTLLGFEPRVSIEDGLAQTVAWYRGALAAR